MGKSMSDPAGSVAAQFVKLCECRCGQPAPVAKKTSLKYGYVKGQPVRFIPGHNPEFRNAQRRGPARLAQFVKLCECGCRQPAPLARQSISKLGQVIGQPLRYIAGHYSRPKEQYEQTRKLFVEKDQQVGRSTVLDPEVTLREVSGTNVRAVRLRCGCGREYTRRIKLLRWDDESCGTCCTSEDLTGQVFGLLTVIRWVPNKRWGGKWLCGCKCGNEVAMITSKLTDGCDHHCGCSRGRNRNGYAPGVGASLSLMRAYIGNARSRGLSWGLTKEDFRRLTSMDCHYCDAPPRAVLRGGPYSGDYLYNGIDRVDNTRGYSLDNCVTACGSCNWWKRDTPYSEFVGQLDYVAAARARRLGWTPPGPSAAVA